MTIREKLDPPSETHNKENETPKDNASTPANSKKPPRDSTEDEPIVPDSVSSFIATTTTTTVTPRPKGSGCVGDVPAATSAQVDQDSGIGDEKPIISARPSKKRKTLPTLQQLLRELCTLVD
ncbi:MAG: hypothetical protein SGILL_002365, partial [Bacillariaceae sp.]